MYVDAACEGDGVVVRATEHTKGLWYGIVSYAIWGWVPLYWKLLQGIPALQLICHRIVWSCAVLIVIIAVSHDWDTLWKAARSPRVTGIYTAAAIAVVINWFIYVWAVNAGFIIQAALGYFINPLVSVVLGVLVFRERLRAGQWAAIGLAAGGVLYLTMVYGSLPWIALCLAFSFGTYGLLKKLGALGAVQGLTLETSILLLPAAIYLIRAYGAGPVGFLHETTFRNLLMIGAGPLTTIPLLLFAAAISRLPLSTMGLLQFLNPTLQFLIGVLVYKEPFNRVQFVGFAVVWAALVMFAAEGYVTRRWFPVEEIP
jgi:chloramphenicol-sensitive protein RarD